jgi:hypothetical protein
MHHEKERNEKTVKSMAKVILKKSQAQRRLQGI